MDEQIEHIASRIERRRGLLKKQREYLAELERDQDHDHELLRAAYERAAKERRDER